MKKNYILSIFILLSVILASSCGNTATKQESKKKEYPSLKARNGELAQALEWQTVQARAQALMDKIHADPNDIKSKLLLAQLYMQEARVTGEHPYYYPATLIILDDVLAQQPDNFEALAFKASVELSLHHFADALKTGTKASKINANNGFIFGVLCDANVELGNYDEAVKMSDRMQSLRPGLEAYSRASYLREIYGNNAGAIEAMKLAFQAGMPSTEEASWAGNTLGHLYENTGELNKAKQTYEAVLGQRPTYAFAMAGLGRIAMKQGHYDEALTMLNKATAQMPEFSFYEDIAEVYELQGKPEKAKETYRKVIDMLNEDAASGHYADMELALAYLKSGDVQNALKHATIEYKRRPENIDVNSTLAWVLYNKGDYAAAQTHMKKAMRMGTQNAQLLCRAGIIESAAGDKTAGLAWVRKANKINPYLPSELKKTTPNA